ncbi:MAG: EF-hand domain-containing protein, partial [Pseudomonadota bacterium]
LAAVAQDGPARDPELRREMMQQRFAKIDGNGDGAISKDEVEAHRAEVFATADADNNGLVTQAELEAHREAHKAEFRSKVFSKVDVDGDGALSLDEFQTPEGQGFDRVDANGDGLLTEDEIKAMGEQARKGRRRRGG